MPQDWWLYQSRHFRMVTMLMLLGVKGLLKESPSLVSRRDGLGWVDTL